LEKAKKNPTYFLRFEDLIADPAKELTGVFSFLLDLEDLTGTNAERRIQHVVGLGQEASQTYATKSTTRQANYNFNKYTDDQIEQIAKDNMRFLHFFGYASAPKGMEKNPTGFLEFMPKREEGLVEDYYKFRDCNKITLQEVAANARKETPEVKTYANYGVRIYTPHFDRTRGSVDYAKKELYSQK